MQKKLKKILNEMLNKNNLHDYQRTVVDFIIDNPKAGVFLDMGLGKTVSTLTANAHLIYEAFEVTKVLVIGTKRVAESVWDVEAEKWQQTKHLRVSRIVGSVKQRTEALHAKAEIYTLGRDNVSWLCAQFGGSKLPFDMLVVDESSSFKNPKSLRFKALKKVAAAFDRVVILTGTPSPNSLMDLWPQIYLLDQGERLGKTITKYREQHFRPNQTNGHIVYNYRLLNGSEKRIKSKIKDICISMKAEDYLDMPDKVVNSVMIRLPKKLLRSYYDFEAEQVLSIISDGIVTAANAAALSNKLMQFANGAIYDEDKNVHHIHNLKLDALEEIIEANEGKPVLVAYNFKHDLQRIQARFKKYKPVKHEKPEHTKDWNAGKIRLLLMHPASGGHGLNIQKGGNTIVWFGLNWSLEFFLQLNARLYRQGQESGKVFIHLLAVEGTIDTDVISRVEDKNAKQEDLLKALKHRINNIKKRYGRTN